MLNIDLSGNTMGGTHITIEQATPEVATAAFTGLTASAAFLGIPIWIWVAGAVVVVGGVVYYKRGGRFARIRSMTLTASKQLSFVPMSVLTDANNREQMRQPVRNGVRVTMATALLWVVEELTKG